MKKENIKKVVLAYSGGLDTSIIIPWLKENYNNCEVVAVSGDVGQGTELDGLEEKAKATGASKLYVLDLKKDFVENYIFPTLKFGAKYEDYLLGTSFAHPRAAAPRFAGIGGRCPAGCGHGRHCACWQAKRCCFGTGSRGCILPACSSASAGG